MSDLFLETKSKKDQVYEFIKQRGRARTSDIIRFGMSIYYNRADRSARDLASEGKIWRIADHIKLSIPEYANTKEDIWSVHEKDKGY